MYYEIETNSDFSTQDYLSDDIVPAEESYLTVSSDADIWNDYAQEILNLVNAERSYAGLMPLKLTGTLMDGAATRADEIIEYFSHTRPDGTSCFTVIEDTYPSYYAGENIAAGYPSAEDVMNGWMNSEGHRANILRPSYTELGVGLAYDEDSDYKFHWSQLFGNPYLAPKNPEDGFTFIAYSDSQTNLKVGSAFNGEVWADHLTDVYYVTDIDAVDNPNSLILAGNVLSNVIYGGSGNSSLWGSSNNVDDTLVGGSGADMFWYGKYEGYDVVTNANSSDTVNLYDVSLSEITAADVSTDQVVLRFNTGTALVIKDNEQVTPIFQLASGERCKYDRDMGQWQDA